MALSDKDILIKPNSGSSDSDARINFVGADASGKDTVVLTASYDGTRTSLDVAGLTTLDSTTIDGTLTVNDSATFTSRLTVDGVSELNSTISHSGPVAFLCRNSNGQIMRVGTTSATSFNIATYTNNVIIKADAGTGSSAAGSLILHNELDKGITIGAPNVNSLVTIDESLFVTDSVSVGGDLDVAGLTTLDSTTVDTEMVIKGTGPLNDSGDALLILRANNEGITASAIGNNIERGDFARNRLVFEDTRPTHEGSHMMGMIEWRANDAVAPLDGINSVAAIGVTSSGNGAGARMKFYLDDATDGTDDIAPNANSFELTNIGAFFKGTTSDVTIEGTAVSTSSTTGALMVAGGVGVGGNIYADGNLTIDGITTLDSTTIAGDLTFSGDYTDFTLSPYLITSVDAYPISIDANHNRYVRLLVKNTSVGSASGAGIELHTATNGKLFLDLARNGEEFRIRSEGAPYEGNLMTLDPAVASVGDQPLVQIPTPVLFDAGVTTLDSTTIDGNLTIRASTPNASPRLLLLDSANASTLDSARSGAEIYASGAMTLKGVDPDLNLEIDSASTVADLIELRYRIGGEGIATRTVARSYYHKLSKVFTVGPEEDSSSMVLTTVNNPVVINNGITSPATYEKTSIVTTAASSYNLDTLSNSILYITDSADATFSLNVRGSSTIPLNNILNIGETISVACLATQGPVAYANTAFQVDGVTQTVKYQGASPTATPESIDVYNFTIIKTAQATFTVLGDKGSFA